MSYGPLVFLVVAAGVIAVTAVVVRAVYHQRVRRGAAWDCGFGRLDARMQDTAEGFGQPIRHIFQPFFRIERELPTPFDADPRYRVTVGDRIWGWVYAPLGALVQRVAKRRRFRAAGADRRLPDVQLPHIDRAARASAMDWTAILTQLLEIAAALAVAPLFMGWVTQCRAWLQNRTAPSLWLPYRAIHKLFHKDAVLAQDASPLFRAAPYVVFGTMVVAAAIIPSMSTLPLTPAADAIALVGLFATARVFLSLAAMDVGTAFGTLGARREMMVGFLAEPALLMVIFVASLISATTALPVISGRLATQAIGLYPSLAFTAVAFTLVLLAENARIPVDNPATHLELTMIHEAMLLEYSARHLALMEWAAALKLFNYACIGFALFVPWGVATGEAGPLALLLSIPLLAVKLAFAGLGIALIETLSAKLRVFRVRSSSRPPSCSRCWGCSFTCCSEPDHDRARLGPAVTQPVRGAAAAAVVRDAVAAPDRLAREPARAARCGAVRGDTAARVADGSGPSVPVRRADARLSRSSASRGCCTG